MNSETSIISFDTGVYTLSRSRYRFRNESKMELFNKIRIWDKIGFVQRRGKGSSAALVTSFEFFPPCFIFILFIC